jgi:hypothetical protein
MMVAAQFLTSLETNTKHLISGELGDSVKGDTVPNFTGRCAGMTHHPARQSELTRSNPGSLVFN